MGGNSTDLINQSSKSVNITTGVTGPDCTIKLSNVVGNRLIVGTCVGNLTLVELETFKAARSLQSSGIIYSQMVSCLIQRSKFRCRVRLILKSANSFKLFFFFRSSIYKTVLLSWCRKSGLEQKVVKKLIFSQVEGE